MQNLLTSNSETGTLLDAPASNLCAIDALSQKARMLDALAAMIVGDGFEAFHSLSAELQEDYLMCISSMASEVRSLTALHAR